MNILFLEIYPFKGLHLKFLSVNTMSILWRLGVLCTHLPYLGARVFGYLSIYLDTHGIRYSGDKVLGYITCMAFRYSTLSRLALVGFLYSFSSREVAATDTLEVEVFRNQYSRYIVK